MFFDLVIQLSNLINFYFNNMALKILLNVLIENKLVGSSSTELRYFIKF